MNYSDIKRFIVNICFSLLLLLGVSCKSQRGLLINVNEHGVIPVKKNSETDEEKNVRYLKIKELFQYAITNASNLYFPKGLYDVGNRNFPFRTPESDTTDNLLDCRNIIIYGEKGSILKTSSVFGADVLQLNRVKNITFRNFEITATLQSYEKSGSNGISITNGFDNITLENIYIHDLPGVDKNTWIDGGKGLTVQRDSSSNAFMGSLTAKNIRVENSAYGFRMDTNHVSAILEQSNTIKIDLDMIVSKAFQGFSIEFGKATANISPEVKLNIKAAVQLNNCQQYVRFARVIGGDFDFRVFRTESYEQVMRDNQNNRWSRAHDGVFAFLSNYTKNARVSIVGEVGEVDDKIWIGAVGSIVEPFNLKNRTENNFFNFDITGLSKNEDIRVIKWAGESLHHNNIIISKQTTKKLPPDFLSNNNRIWR